jgi:hypothetical protein
MGAAILGRSPIWLAEIFRPSRNPIFSKNRFAFKMVWEFPPVLDKR